MSIQKLYDTISQEYNIKESDYRHSSVYYCKAALEEKFKPRKFTLDEVEKLLQEEFGWKDNI